MSDNILGPHVRTLGRNGSPETDWRWVSRVDGPFLPGTCGRILPSRQQGKLENW